MMTWGWVPKIFSWMSVRKPSITASVISNAATPSIVPPMAINVVTKRKTPKRWPARKRLARKNSKVMAWPRLPFGQQSYSIFRFEQREQNHFANRRLSEKQHRQTVNSNTEPAGRRHAMLKSVQESFVDDLGLKIAFLLGRGLTRHALALVHRI